MGEVAQAWDAQGNPIPAPAKQTWDANGKPISADTTTSTSSAPQPGVLSQLSNWWENTTKPLTEIQPHQMPHSAADVVREVGRGVGNIGAGALGVALHPLDTLGAMGSFALRSSPPAMLMDTMRGKPNVGQEIGTQIAQHPLETTEAGIGQAGAMPFLESELKAPVKAVKAIPRIARAGADIITGTTPAVAGDLADTTQAANVKTQTAADAANADIQAKRAADLQKHFEKTQAVRAQNEAAEAAQSRKVALNRGVEQLDPKFQEDLKATEKDVRAQAGAKYDTVRAATAGETISPESLTDAVKQAEAKIQGSSENLKVFRDILSKSPESGDDFVFQGGAKFGPGTALYESVKATPEGLPSSAPPVTFSDLQGYYSELGSQLARGNLPGDVYLATKSLQGSIGDLMQQMAESKGAGGLLTDARTFYSKYMDAFRDSRSPLNRAMNAKEAGQAIKQFQGKDQSGVGVLAQYSPDLAKRANTIRGYQAEAKSIPARGPAPKSEPVLPPPQPPVLADVKKIGLGDIQNAKAEALQNRAETIRNRGGHLATSLAVFDAMRNLFHGNLAGVGEDIAVRTAYGIGKQAMANFLERPGVVRYLTAPTPSDIAAIPPDLRANMPQIVKAAQAQGIKVHPALLSIGAVPRPQPAQ